MCRIRFDPAFSLMTEEELFNHATGGASHGRNYGFGSLYKTATTKRVQPACYADHPSLPEFSYDDAIREKVQELLREKDDKIEELRRNEEKNAQMLQMLMDQQQRYNQLITLTMSHIGMQIPPNLVSVHIIHISLFSNVYIKLIQYLSSLEI